MDNAIGLASASGKAGAEGRYTALFFSVLALGTLTRIVLGLAGTPQTLGAAADWLPVIALGQRCHLAAALRRPK